MTFDAHEAGTDIDGSHREILTGDQFRDAAPSLVIAAGDDAA